MSLNPWKRKVSYFKSRDALQRKCLEKVRRGHLNLKGLGGSGKSQLSRDVVESLHNAEGFSAYEIDASSKDAFEKDTHRFLLKLTNPEFFLPVGSYLEDELENLYEHPKGDMENVVVILDDVTEETYCLVDKFVKADRQFKLITTTKNDTYPADQTVHVKGFTPDEALAFYKQDNDSQASDEDILKLCKKLSFMPLPLAIAKARLKGSPLSIEEYIEERILTRSAEIAHSEMQELKENEYSKDMISAVLSGVEHTMERFNHKRRKAFRILAFMDENRFCISRLIGMHADEKDKDGLTKSDIDFIIQDIRNSCLGTVYEDTKKGQFFVDIHSIVQIAIRHRNKAEDQAEMLEDALVFLTHVSDMDARNQDKASWIPHLKAALDYIDFYCDCNSADRQTLIIKFARIKLRLALGHRYMDQGDKYNQKKTIMKALEDYQKCYKTGTILKMTKEDIRKFGESLIEQPPLEGIRKLIIGRVLRDHDVNPWSQRHPNLQIPKNQRLNEILYEELQQHNLAVAEDEMKRVCIAWLLCTILYQYGRLYLFKGHADRNAENRQEHKHAFDLTEELADVIKEHIRGSKKLFEQFLTKRSAGYMLLDNIGNEEEQLEKAEQANQLFLNLLEDTSDYYEDGLLKKSQNDTFNQIVCTRQLVRSYTKMLSCNVGEQHHHETQQKAFKYAKEKCEEILHNPESYPHPDLFFPLESELCRLYITLGRNDEAIQHFENALARAIEEKQLFKLVPSYFKEAVQDLQAHLSENQKTHLGRKLREHMAVSPDEKEVEMGQAMLDQLGFHGPIPEAGDEDNRCSAPVQVEQQ